MPLLHLAAPVGVLAVSGGTVINHGLISAQAPSRGGIGFLSTPGTAINFGTITAPNTAPNTGGVFLGAGGEAVNQAGAVILTARYGVALGGPTALLPNYTQPGTVTNLGAISGAVGIYVGANQRGDDTILNAGTITGTAGSAIELMGGGQETIILEPTSVLAGAIAGLAVGDSIDFAGLGGAGVSVAGGMLNLVAGTGATIASVGLAGTFVPGQFLVTQDGSGGTDVRPEQGLPLSADFLGDGRSDLLMTEDGGPLVVDEVSSDPTMSYTQIGGLGPEWQFEGDGGFLGDGRNGFLLWAGNSADPDFGSLVVAEDVGSIAQYTAIGGVGAAWQFEGTGSFLGQATSDFLLWNNQSGAIVVGSVVNSAAQYAEIGGVGPNWQFVGAGDYLGDGHSGFLLENSSNGVLVVGEDVDGTPQYTQIGAVGPNWQFVGAGDFDGENASEFMARDSSSGALVIGAVSGGTSTYTAVGGVGPEWNFHTTNIATVA